MRGGLLTAGGIAVFAGLLFWMTLRQQGVDCEVCVDWGPHSFCASVAAPNREEAQTQAQTKACGVVTGGMADELACQRSQPRSVTCTP